MISRRRLLGALPFAVATLAGCRDRPGGRLTLRLGHGLDTGHPVHRAMERMAVRLGETTGGALGLEIFPSEQLGSERECLELLQIGSLDLTKVSAAVLENFAPALRVLGVPYLFRDRAHERAVLDGEVGHRLLLEPLPARLRGLAWLDAGRRSFYTRERRIERPEDLAGLKIRTQESPMAMRMVSAFGGSPTPISWGELYSALQQGVVDGAENNPPSFYVSRHYEVCPYYTLDEHTAVPDVLLVAEATWQRLSQAERAALSGAAEEAAIVQRELWRQATEEALAAVEAAGVEVVRPDLAPFAERAASLHDELRQDLELGPWLRRVEAVGRTGAPR